MSDNLYSFAEKLDAERAAADQKRRKHIAAGVAGGIALGALTFIGLRFRVCKPNQYLVRTGLGIKHMAVSRKAIQWPFQKASFMDMNPRTYSFDLHNMSKGKVEFKLPVVFTIGPRDPQKDLAAFERYAQTLNDMDVDEVHRTIQGVIEGETRALTAALDVEEMFNAKDRFREEVVSKIQLDLDKMGLEIYNANIKEMGDYDERNKYFEYRKQRAIESANYEAQVDVAEAKKMGEIGMKERERDTRVSVAKMDMETKLAENERNQSVAVSNAKLAEVEAQARLTKELANIHTNNESQRQNEVFQQEVERQRAQRQLEKLRADALMQTKVLAEQKVVEAEGTAKAIRTVAEANLYRQEQEAMGVKAMLEAHSVGLQRLLESAQDNPDMAKFYLGLKEHLFQDIAAEQAKAFKDMKPQISVWHTGQQMDTTGNPMEVLTRGLQSMAPIVDGLQKHTGLNVPFWMPGNGKPQ
jgi:flotillin